MFSQVSVHRGGGSWLLSMHDRSHDQGGLPPCGGLPPEGSLPLGGGVCLQGILHLGGGFCIGWGVCIKIHGYYGIRSTSGRYASYRNAFLLKHANNNYKHLQ